MRKTKTNAQSNYTFIKRNVFYLSRRVPGDLQQYYQRPRIVRSLRTKQPKEAATAAHLLSSQLDQLWFQLRLQKQTELLSGLSHFQQHSIQLTLEEALAYYLEQKGKARSQLFHKHAMLHVSYLHAAVPNTAKLKDFTIEKSYESLIVKKFDLKDIPRKLTSKEYYSAGYITKYSNEQWKDMDKVNIKIITGSDYINISNGNNVNSINCYIDGQTNTTFANIYYNTMYKNNYYGSGGGSVTQLPYFGYYNLIELKDSKTHENCGNLIVSFNEDKKPLFTYSKSDPIDGLLIDNGHILTNK